MRPLVLFAVMCLAASAGAAPARAQVVPQRNWQRIDSPNFTVVGEVGARELRQVAERMEQLHELLTALMGRQDLRAPDTTVIVFRDKRAYRPFQPRYLDKPVDDVVGYFIPGPMNYITVLAGRNVDYRSTVYHEYVHLATRSTVGTLPLWISEGLAEFYSTFEVVSGGRGARVGGLLQHHVWSLQRELLPLATLAAMDRDSPYYNEDGKSTVFYAESWALVHFLQIGKDRKYAAKASAFIEAVTRGVPFEQACTTHLGTTAAELERELRAYIYSPVFFQLVITLSDRIDRIARIEPVSVPEATAHATLGNLLERMGFADDAREHLEHARRMDATEPLALAVLADLTAESGRFAEAAALVKEGAQASRHTYHSHYYRARALVRGHDHASFDPALYESALRGSVALNPDFADAHADLARYRASTPAGLQEATALVTRARALAPAREDYVLLHAQVLLRLGDTRGARNIVGPLMARGTTAEIKAEAREILTSAARVELEATRASASPPELGRSAPEGEPASGSPVADPAPEAGLPPPGELTPLTMVGTTGLPVTTGPRDPNARGERAIVDGVILDLRPVGTGESRVFGRFAAVECATDGVVLIVDTAGGTLRARAPALDQVEFITHRNNTGGRVLCGPQPGTPPALVTVRPDDTGTLNGAAVAVEVMPDGYRPPGR